MSIFGVTVAGAAVWGGRRGRDRGRTQVELSRDWVSSVNLLHRVLAGGDREWFGLPLFRPSHGSEGGSSCVGVLCGPVAVRRDVVDKRSRFL